MFEKFKPPPPFLAHDMTSHKLSLRLDCGGGLAEWLSLVHRLRHRHKDVHTCDMRMPSASHVGNILIRHFYRPRGDLVHR